MIVQQQNGPQFVIATLAAWSIGASIVPVSPMYTSAEVKAIAIDSGARAWLMTPRQWDAHGEAAVSGTNLRVLLTARTSEFSESVEPRIAEAEDGDGPVEGIRFAKEIAANLGSPPRIGGLAGEQDAPGPSEEAILAYTSGSTGRPRGVRVSHGNLISIGRAYVQASGVDSEAEVLLAMAPLVHITGLSLHIGAWLATGCQLVLADRFEPATFLKAIEEHHVTWTTGAATAYLAMMKAGAENVDLSSWRYAGCGGAPIPPQLAREVAASLGVELGPGYGLTESTAAVTTTPVGEVTRVDEETGIVSVGKPLPGVSVRIVDEHGATLKPHQEGLIQVAGPGRTLGYWQDEVATRAAYLPDGWLQTNDMGFRDDRGWLYIAGRQSQVIIASGYKVWPRQVEDVLYAHPLVREAAVVGAADEYRGETVVAYVSLKAPVSEEELREYCQEALAAYKVPRAVRFLPELPKNPNGKIDSLRLKEMANAGD